MPQTITTICPVCGYAELEALFLAGGPYLDGSICPSCGTEFGYSDFQRTHDELRQEWIGKNHAQWWSRSTPMPPGWSPVNQLWNIKYRCTPSDIRMMERSPAANSDDGFLTRV